MGPVESAEVGLFPNRVRGRSPDMIVVGAADGRGVGGFAIL